MNSTITVQRISGGSTFKVLFIGCLTLHIVSTLIVAALVMAGILPIEPTYAVDTESMAPIFILGAYLLVGVVLSPVWVGVLWLSIWPGVWLYSLFRPMNLAYVPRDERPGT